VIITPRVSLDVWEHKRGEVTPVAAALVAAGELEPAGLRVEVVGSRGDHVTVLIVSGELEDEASILYVERLGTFEIVGVRSWPVSGWLLLLRVWP
jgi:hypothetical protein